MTPGRVSGTNVGRRPKMWWLAPVFVVATTAVASTVLFVPELGAHVAVPRQVVVFVPASEPPAPTSPTPRPQPHRTHHPAPRPTPTTPALTPVEAEPTPVVVQPQRPVVRVDDDKETSGYERESGDK